MSQNRYGCCFISRKRWKGGKRMEQEEWKQIYEIYQRPLFLYALSLTKNIQDAEDLLQETFIKAFLSYEKNIYYLENWQRIFEYLQQKIRCNLKIS